MEEKQVALMWMSIDWEPNVKTENSGINLVMKGQLLLKPQTTSINTTRQNKGKNTHCLRQSPKEDFDSLHDYRMLKEDNPSKVAAS